MTDHQLDTVYTQLCRTMTELGETDTPLFLARFALLMVDRLDDASVALSLIDAARDGL